MKKETRYEMLTHIDQKYIDEAYPKKRNIASVLIPVAACACVLALLAPTVITALRTPPETVDEGIILDRDFAVQAHEAQKPEPTQAPTAPQVEADGAPPSNESEQSNKGENIPIETIKLTPIVIEDPYRDTYLGGYTSLLMADEGNSVSEPCYPMPPETEKVTFTWNDVVDFYGKDIRPLYIPDSLKGTDMESAEYTFSRVTEDHAPYEVGDYYRDDISMVYKENPERELSPANRGVYISAQKTSYTDVTETMRYSMTLNAKDSLSYYNGVPILFYVPSDRITSSVMNGSEALSETNDIHLTEEYQALLEEFLAQRPELLEDEYFRGDVMKEWDTFLKQNGIPEGEPTFNEKHWYDNYHYYAIVVHDGIEYTMESNLDFETFAAIVASLIHD